MRSPGDVWQAVFDTFTSELQARPSFSLPKRRFIAAGDVVADCGQFVVHGGATYPGIPGQHVSGYQQASGGVSLHAVDVEVILFRCVGAPNVLNAAPTEKEMNELSKTAGDDAQALTETFWAVADKGVIAPSCDWLYFGGVGFAGPEGGIIQTILTMAVEL